MSSGRKCKNCGSLDIEVDPARGDAVCTNCGSVLEDNIIVAEVQFEENTHGATNAIGQFVSADSKGGPNNFGASFHIGQGIESREVTLKKARNGITNLCSQLRLNQHCVDTACNFFKMALARNLTRGRKNTHMFAACVYMTCRTEGTPHMLIDISDVLQICCYELGRTYLRISQALCINIPSMDPCLYILRFAAKLEFEGKTQEVANTALRLVQRMKRDSIHSGRRPSGLCGAALLMAARLHNFNRTTVDIVKIVKIHESTLRKRLMEFGDTPSSALTLDEFMTVDLEEEQDPPSFKAARKKDKERLQKLMEEEADHITELQKDIETQLDASYKRCVLRDVKFDDERTDESKFIKESTLGVIGEILNDELADDPENTGRNKKVVELGPNIASMGLACSLEDVVNAPTNTPSIEVNLTFDDIDDDELDAYIMTEDEVKHKNGLWLEENASYLELLKEKEEKMAKEKEEGKPEKKKRRVVRKKQQVGPASSAGEAIEKMLQEKKVSSKINYEVLKSLTTKPEETGEKQTKISENIVKRRPSSTSPAETPKSKRLKPTVNVGGKLTKRKMDTSMGLPLVEETKEQEKNQEEPKELDTLQEDYYEDDEEDVVAETEVGVLQMLRQHQQNGADEAEDIYGIEYDEEEY
ncbi:hypothetical protein RN001_001429 [Aquatica leii]|uniref:B-related factor 1 n=1 Tax=Aquatica leii TaxID=1421715 RepID=A0AAN7PGA0_9COLE|nr:hypothetical protein RN001_001429 [Aquatica leii]